MSVFLSDFVISLLLLLIDRLILRLDHISFTFSNTLMRDSGSIYSPSSSSLTICENERSNAMSSSWSPSGRRSMIALQC
jgi:hypothetical protein